MGWRFDWETRGLNMREGQSRVLRSVYVLQTSISGQLLAFYHSYNHILYHHLPHPTNSAPNCHDRRKQRCSLYINLSTTNASTHQTPSQYYQISQLHIPLTLPPRPPSPETNKRTLNKIFRPSIFISYADVRPFLHRKLHHLFATSF